jgi:hypothetical protein
MWSLLQLKEANINRKMWGTKVAKEVVLRLRVGGAQRSGGLEEADL